LRTFTKAWFDDAGAPIKTELYDAGTLIGVNYHQTAGVESTVASHQHDHPGVRCFVWTVLAANRGHVWKHVRSYDSTGNPIGVSKILSDLQGRERMQIDQDVHRRQTRITKYHWSADGQLRYVFEFDGDGRLYAI